MATEVSIAVVPRESAGKNESRRLRRQGMVPAIVYGGGREPEGIAVDPRPVDAVLSTERGKNTLIHLTIGDRELKRMVLIREIQRHPVTDRIMHADFVRIEMDKKTEVWVPLNIVGVPLGVKNEGGMLEWVHRQVHIRVLPGDIPEHIDVDVSALHVGQHISAGDVTLPGGADLLMPPTDPMITVVGKKAEEEAAAAPAEGEAAAAAAPPAEETPAPKKK